MGDELNTDLEVWIEEPASKPKARKLTEDIASWIVGDVDIDEEGTL